MLFVGIDWASVGAAAVVDDSGGPARLVKLWSWKLMRRKSGPVMKLVEKVSGEVSEHLTAACMGKHCAEQLEGPYRVVCESQYVQRNARAGLVLARGAGMYTGPLLSRAIESGTPPGEVVRFMTPGEWRVKHFGKGKRLTRDQHKIRAITEAHRLTGLRLTDDEAEAVLMAIVCQKLV